MTNLSYELAKELKDAGFPQLHCGNTKFIMPKDIVWQNEMKGPRCINAAQVWDEYSYSEENVCYLPTLSELIEACGDGYFFLERSARGWYAKNTPLNALKHRKPFGEGTTPEEAVAKLWLALNKKQNDN